MPSSISGSVSPRRKITTSSGTAVRSACARSDRRRCRRVPPVLVALRCSARFALRLTAQLSADGRASARPAFAWRARPPRHAPALPQANEDSAGTAAPAAASGAGPARWPGHGIEEQDVAPQSSAIMQVTEQRQPAEPAQLQPRRRPRGFGALNEQQQARPEQHARTAPRILPSNSTQRGAKAASSSGRRRVRGVARISRRTARQSRDVDRRMPSTATPRIRSSAAIAVRRPRATRLSSARRCRLIPARRQLGAGGCARRLAGKAAGLQLGHRCRPAH